MENGELHRLLTEQLNNRMDRLENTIQHYLDKQSALCKDHDNRIDQEEKTIAIIQDRQTRAETLAKKRLSIILVSIPVIGGILNFLWSKFNLN